VNEVKRYWVRNDDLHENRVRDNPREVVLVHDYDRRAPDPLLGLVRELRDALVALENFTRTYGHGDNYVLLARVDVALAEPRPGESAGEKEGA
jgi:hypothetical protein